jgi:aryl-alcohol dehydrogenase-like predicted oxidoreductase
MSIDGVDTVVLGVKNRSELAECLAAAEAGPLPAEVIEQVDQATAPLRQGPPKPARARGRKGVDK